MIIDLEKFLADERPAWAELELSLKKLEEEPNLQLSSSKRGVFTTCTKGLRQTWRD